MTPSAPTRMSSTMRTPWPSRSAPHHCSASQIDGSPNPSPAWIVMWKFSLATYWNASRWRLGGLPASAPAISNPPSPPPRGRAASSAISRAGGAARRAPGLAPGDIESDSALVAVADRRLGDLQRAGRGPHRGEQGVDGDAPPPAAAPEYLQQRGHALV